MTRRTQKDPFCKAKPLSGNRKGREENPRNRSRAPSGTLSVTWCFLAFPLKHRMPLLGLTGQREDKNGSTISRACNAEDQKQCAWHFPEDLALQHQFHNASAKQSIPIPIINIGEWLLCTATVLINLGILSHFALPTTQWTMSYYYPHCTYGNTEAQVG